MKPAVAGPDAVWYAGLPAQAGNVFMGKNVYSHFYVVLPEQGGLAGAG